jgi:hypothetical protein
MSIVSMSPTKLIVLQKHATRMNIIVMENVLVNQPVVMVLKIVWTEMMNSVVTNHRQRKNQLVPNLHADLVNAITYTNNVIRDMIVRMVQMKSIVLHPAAVRVSSVVTTVNVFPNRNAAIRNATAVTVPTRPTVQENVVNVINGNAPMVNVFHTQDIVMVILIVMMVRTNEIVYVSIKFLFLNETRRSNCFFLF